MKKCNNDFEIQAFLGFGNSEDDVDMPLPFSKSSEINFYKKVISHYDDAKIVSIGLSKALKLGVGNTKKASFIPVAEGHIFWKSMTEAKIPVDKVLPPELPDIGIPHTKTSYGAFPFEDEASYGLDTIHMIVYRGHYYWLEALQARNPNAYSFYWGIVPTEEFSRYAKIKNFNGDVQ